MKKLLYLIAIAGCVAIVSCKNNGNKPTEVAKADTVNNPTDDNTVVKPKGVLPNPEDGLSGDALEHEVPNIWPKQSIYVKQNGSKLNIIDIFTAIVEVYPIPQILEAWYTIDESSLDKSKGSFVCDEKHNFISGEWPDPEYGNNFALKAWEMMEDNQWMIGLVYNRLWDGDDGVGVYQNLMFWTYDANNEHILRPVDTTERFLPVYTPQRGIVVFRPDNDNLDFEDGADPSLFWKWNGYWFVSSAPQE